MISPVCYNERHFASVLQDKAFRQCVIRHVISPVCYKAGYFASVKKLSFKIITRQCHQYSTVPIATVFGPTFETVKGVNASPLDSSLQLTIMFVLSGQL